MKAFLATAAAILMVAATAGSGVAHASVHCHGGHYGITFSHGTWYHREHFHYTYHCFSHHYGCHVYWHPGHNCYYYWCASAGRYYPVSYISYAPPVDSAPVAIVTTQTAVETMERPAGVSSSTVNPIDPGTVRKPLRGRAFLADCPNRPRFVFLPADISSTYRTATNGQEKADRFSDES